MKKLIILLPVITAMIFSCADDDPITPAPLTDFDGNEYKEVTIGEQTWMAENLRTTHYADGTEIPNVTSETAWVELGDNSIDKAYSYYDNDIELGKTNGAIYTWAAAMNGAASTNNNPSEIQGACPTDWHVPSDAEWAELVNYVGDNGHEGVEGNALKSIILWNEDGLTDPYGFSAFPSGGFNQGTPIGFVSIGTHTLWWSGTQSSTIDIYTYQLDKGFPDVFRDNQANKSSGHSVQCIKD